MFALVMGAAYVTQPHSSPISVRVSPASNSTASVAISGTSGTGYTMTEVQQHNSASSCWAAINGNVYDLTNWINQHPGGQGPILSLCGTDGSAAFNGQHGGQARPASELKNFLLGPLSS